MGLGGSPFKLKDQQSTPSTQHPSHYGVGAGITRATYASPPCRPKKPYFVNYPFGRSRPSPPRHTITARLTCNVGLEHVPAKLPLERNPRMRSGSLMEDVRQHQSRRRFICFAIETPCTGIIATMTGPMSQASTPRRQIGDISISFTIILDLWLSFSPPSSMTLDSALILIRVLPTELAWRETARELPPTATMSTVSIRQSQIPAPLPRTAGLQ